MSKNTRTRILLTAVAALLLVTMAVGGTLAWLVDETTPVTNTFTPADIDIELGETTPTSYKLVPGTVYNKNPKVTVKADTDVEIYLFVKVEEIGSPATYLTYETTMYTVAEDGTKTAKAPWALVPDQTDVWYRTVAPQTPADDQSWNLLVGNETYDDGIVTVKDSLKETEMPTGEVKLQFTAYGIQTANMTDSNNNGSPVDEAYKLASSGNN